MGYTITEEKNPCVTPLSRFKTSYVFVSYIPISSDFANLKESLAKLRLNDISFAFKTEISSTLVFCFKYGFLHLEIIQERLEREFNLDLIITALV